MSLRRSILNNGIANVVQKIVRILDQLLLVPFFLISWGTEYYGEWLTLSIVPSILAFSDLGFGSAVSNSFVLAYAAGNKQQAINLYKSGFLIITASVILGVFLTTIIVVGGSLAGWFDKSAIEAKDTIIAVSVMMASKLISFYSQLVEAFYRSARHAALGSFISSGHSLLNIIVGLIALYAGCGVIGFATSQFVVAFLFTILYWIIGRRMISFNGLKGEVISQDIQMIVRKGIAYLATPVWQSTYFQGTTFVVRLALGAEAVAIFNTVRTVCRSINQMFSIINAAIFPDLQFEYGRGNIELVQRIFRKAVKVSIIIGFFGCVTLSVIGLDIYNWWTQNILSVDVSIWYMFMASAFFNAVWWTSVVTYRMTNQPKRFAIASTTMAFISVAVCYLTSLQWGLMGAAFATTLFELCMAMFILPDSCRLLGMKLSDLICIKKNSKFKKE